jgi:hypothetical protein
MHARKKLNSPKTAKNRPKPARSEPQALNMPSAYNKSYFILSKPLTKQQARGVRRKNGA